MPAFECNDKKRLNIPYLPLEIWEIILSYGGLFFAPYLRLSCKEIAAKKIQDATRYMASFRVSKPWKEGLYVRVYRRITRKWLIGRILCLRFDNTAVSEHWAIVVVFAGGGPRLLIFLADGHPPVRTL